MPFKQEDRDVTDALNASISALIADLDKLPDGSVFPIRDTVDPVFLWKALDAQASFNVSVIEAMIALQKDDNVSDNVQALILQLRPTTNAVMTLKEDMLKRLLRTAVSPQVEGGDA